MTSCARLINFYLYSFLPTDPTSFPWCSVEQDINLACPYSSRAHVIAAAEDNDDLKSFLDCIACKLNLTAIASTSMPSGSGRKGGN